MVILEKKIKMTPEEKYARLNPWRLFFVVALPGMISMFAMSIYSVIEGAFTGDVNEDAAAAKAAAYAPVADGVGAVTVTLLMGHTLEAARRSLQ